jgi:hypothetical protein
MSDNVFKSFIDLAKEKMPSHVWLEKPKFLKDFQAAVEKIASSNLYPNWHMSIKVGGTLFNQLAKTEPNNPNILKMFSDAKSSKMKNIFKVKNERKTGFVEIKTFLDSGANDVMFNDKTLSNNLVKSKTRIETATKGDVINETSVGKVKLFYPDGKTVFSFGENNQALFSEKLADNLVSVSKICENNLAVLFSKEKYVIYANNLKVQGRKVHEQARDPQTGLYPLTLLKQVENSCDGGPKGTELSHLREKYATHNQGVVAYLEKQNFEKLCPAGKAKQSFPRLPL